MYWHFSRWEEAKVTEQITAALRRQVRTAQGRSGEPSAGIIDSQSVKGTDTVGRPTRGYDAGKKDNGRKRFIVTDTLGLLLVVCVMAASVRDRDGARTTLLSLYLCTPVRFVFADAGFAGKLVAWAERFVATAVHIVCKAPGQVGFAVIPRRWVAERSPAWSTSHRCLARDYGRDPAVSEAMVRWAAIGQMARRLARGRDAVRQRAWTSEDIIS